MPRMSKSEAPDKLEVEGYEGAFGTLGPDYTVGFERYTADADLRDLFKGLPDDRCQCAHWGYVMSGKVTFHTADGDETYSAGDAYYIGPGHTPELFAGTEVVEFSPTEELARTVEAVERNMAAMG
ncbi:MAG: cupin domain-containing protein [Actinomycetota bacterium]